MLTLNTTRSYFARYRHKQGGTLIGGVRQGQTSRFGLRADAQKRLDQTIEINGGPDVVEGEVVASPLPPEIFPHCHGSIAQAIGGKCFRCGHVLTKDDAKKYAP